MYKWLIDLIHEIAVHFVYDDTLLVKQTHDQCCVSIGKVSLYNIYW